MTLCRSILAVSALLVLACASAADRRQLFNGRDLTGWRHSGFGSFEIEAGVLRTRGGVGILWYEREKIGNALLRVVYKVDTREDNSGVFVRIPEAPEDPWMAVEKGLEIQINGAGKSAYHRTGSIYTFSEAGSDPGRPGDWNVMVIRLDGDTTSVRINGRPVSEYTEGDEIPARQNEWDPAPGPRPERGYIGLQNHPQGTGVYFREISLEPLTQ
jgi:hypothetical protein